jgi:hypothetical protein
MLSILCVTSGLERAEPFYAHFRDVAERLGAECVILRDGEDIHSAGYIESVLDEAIARTTGDYVLRLDDDERCSPAMLRWLEAREYLAHDHWHFPRVHLWENPESMLTQAPFFPDFQTRLSVRAKAGNRPMIHSASPWQGYIAKVCIEHWMFLVKSSREMAQTSQFYTKMMYGDGPQPVDPHPLEQPWPVVIGEYKDGAIPLGHSWAREGRIR